MQRYTLDTVDSTNLEAKRMLVAGGLSEPALLTAREQTAGRGSRGRSWVSPRDAGVYMTLIDVPSAPVAATRIDPTLFTLAAGIACVDVLREFTGVEVGIKPVNDLFVDGRKLGGILTEAIVEQEAVRALITGVGINVRAVARSVGANTAEPVALQQVMSAHVFAHLDGNALTTTLAECMLRMNGLVWQGRTDEVRRSWEAHSIDELPAAPET